jgi:ABC-type multidrug transport system ATPase subunit
MDPVSRRFMWDFISETMSSRAVILTTHSMEECEALCNKIGILVSGQLKCLGTSQHLKTKFGKGFQLDISTAGKNPNKAQEFIRSQFPAAEQVEAYGNKLKYKVNQSGLTLKSLFQVIEQHKAEAEISEYSLGQTTLEQIFIYFAKKGDDQKDLSENHHFTDTPQVFVSPALQIAAGLPTRSVTLQSSSIQ